MKKNSTENTEGQKANARGENNDIIKQKRAVVASLSYPPGGGIIGQCSEQRKISKKIKKETKQ